MTSDNSHYSIFKELVNLSTKCRNFNAQKARRAKMVFFTIGLPRFERSGFDKKSDLFNLYQIGKSTIATRQFVGGGEGIRTPDPMVANHVLCQLSYTP